MVLRHIVSEELGTLEYSSGKTGWRHTVSEELSILLEDTDGKTGLRHIVPEESKELGMPEDADGEKTGLRHTVSEELSTLEDADGSTGLRDSA